MRVVDSEKTQELTVDLGLKADPERLGLLLNALDNPHSKYACLDSNEREAIREHVLEYARAQGVTPQKFSSKQKRARKPVDASTLLEKLDDLGRERAESLPLFADSSRLARKPRCSNSKSHSVIRSAPHALAHAYIQPNSPVAYIRLVFDLDWHDENHPHHALSLRDLAERNGWQETLSVPSPNWTTLSRDKNSAHVGYEVATPVGCHENAGHKPQRFLAAIEDALGDALGADEGFAGLLCKNPLSARWDLYKCHPDARDLKTLANALGLKPDGLKKSSGGTRKPRGAVGRNVYLFDTVRFWAYEHIEKYRAGRYEDFLEAVLIQAQIVNAGSYLHLPLSKQDALFFSECRAIARSVAKWVWNKYGTQELTDVFRKRQAKHGALGAAAAAATKRQNRQEQIIDAIGQLTASGKPVSLRSVAELVGCSYSTLSKHYKHLFP